MNRRWDAVLGLCWQLARWSERGCAIDRDEVAPERFGSRRRRVEKAAGISMVLVVGAAMTACSTVATKAATSVALTASDSMKTIQYTSRAG